MKNLPNHVILRHVGQIPFVKKEMAWVLVLAYLNILVILMLGANLSAFPTAIVLVKKRVLKINAKILVLEFVV